MGEIWQLWGLMSGTLVSGKLVSGKLVSVGNCGRDLADTWLLITKRSARSEGGDIGVLQRAMGSVSILTV